MDFRNHKNSVWMYVKKTARILAASLGLLLFCTPAFSQSNYGRVFGGISDQTGGAIVGATVTVLDVARGVPRVLTTDGAGEYSAPSLIPGTYTVRVEASGFRTTERTGILVAVGQDVRVDLSLQPGEQTQTITVSGEAPEINTTNATLGGDIQQNTLNELPINGRSYVKLLAYHPGIVETPGGGSPNWSSNGTRQMAQNWMLDGVDNNDNYAAVGPIIGGSQGFNEVTILPVDSIQEVNVIENPKAEFGWREGAQVNVGLKSGTNNIHGSGYAFGRTGALDARNAFLSPQQPKAFDDLEQFGASIGGPIKKDRLFYFGNYEGQRFTVGSPESTTVPSSLSGAGVGGSIPDAIAGIVKTAPTGANALSTLSLNLAGCNATQVASIAAANGKSTTGPQIAAACSPTSGLFTNGQTATSVFTAFNNVGGSNNAIEKVDYHLNEHNTLNAEYVFGQGHFDTRNSALVQPYWATLYNARTQVARGVWVWAPNSSWVNEARFGYDRYNLVNAAAECEQALGQPSYQSAFGFISGATEPPPACGFPTISISGGGSPTFTGLGGSNGGSGAGGEIVLIGTWSGIDDVSYTRGKHLFKFGGDLHDTGLDGWGNPTNATGTISFGTQAAFTGATGLEDFLAGFPSTGSILVGNAVRDIRSFRFGLFAQDDWRILPRLTLNLGLRYEYMTPITEANSLLGNFNFGATSGTPFQQVGNGLGSPYSTDKKDFAPRIGVAWDVTGKGTTVIRAGSGLVYNTLIPFGALISVRGANLAQIPTGATLIGPSGNVISNPTGNINDATITVQNGPLFPWSVNTPVFNATPSQEFCGNGETTSGKTNPSACAVMGITPYVPTAYILTWTLGVQHAFTNSLSAEVSYVGNHGGDLSNLFDINQPTPGPKTSSGTSTSPALNEQNRRPYYADFPFLSTIKIYEDEVNSNYNGLQASLTQRMSHGLSITAGYTFDHALDENSSEFNFATMNSNNVRADYGPSSVVAPQQITLTASYVIPGIKSPGQMLQGWQINGTFAKIVGLHVNATDAADDFSGTGEGLDRWTLAGSASTIDSALGGNSIVPCFGVAGSSFAKATNGQTNAPACTPEVIPTGTTIGSASYVSNMPAPCVAAATSEAQNSAMNAATPGSSNGLLSLAQTGCYDVNGSVIVPPAQGTYGTMPRDVLERTPFTNFDFSVSKNWKFGERLNAQFRAEFFNVLNLVERSSPAVTLSSPGTFGTALTTPNGANPIVGNGGPRLVQLGLKLVF